MFYNQEFVYFIHNGRSENESEIKIGWSHDPNRRMQDLQTANGKLLKVLGVIPGAGFYEEQKLHEKFKHLQTEARNEWFQDDPSVRLEIRRSLTNDDLKKKFEKYIENLTEFGKNGKYSHLFHWVKEKVIGILPSAERLVVIAPPKSGKRIMAQSCVLLYPQAKHIFITAQNKKDMIVQQEEHTDIGLTYISATNLSNEYYVKKGGGDGIIPALKKELDKHQNGEIIIHFDECDFGSGISKDNKTKSVHNRLLEIVGGKPNVRMISYSATPEEAIFEPANPDHMIMYHPPESYVGPESYTITASEAEKFFIVNSSEFNFSSQGVEALNLLKDSDKRFGIVRISYNEGKKSLYSTLNNNQDKLRKIISDLGLDITFEFIDQSNSERFGWSYLSKDKSKKGFWKNYTKKCLIIVNHVAERGTEVGFHPDIAFWHEWAGPKTSYATVGQRFGRIFYYKGFYDSNFNSDYDPIDFRNEIPNIKLYCPLDALKAMKKAYSAKDGMEFKQIWENAEIERPIGNPKRVKTRSVKKADVEIEIEIFDTEDAAKEVAKICYGSKSDWNEWIQYTRKISNQKDPSHDYVLAVLNGRLATSRAVIWYFDTLSSVATNEQKASWARCVKEHPEYIGKYLVLKTKNVSSSKKKPLKTYATSNSLHSNGIN